ncbi:hypothetical protein PY257_13170 [Ramlibacter sp. H39-3-26]|uniref:hypothetical protein n=1 Tax=Curvibacter soli TaxID=3031331 RepID=UPI0023DBEA9F|nr:hypothetical protein [Ramlibacter sp. H39-3-26]MDF1486119.1 hypothetical protein [Ramlibacter sp. H39-3-26]
MSTIPTELPMALYKAQLDFFMRTGALLQESGQRWVEFSTEHLKEGALARPTGPAELLQRQFGDMQTLAQEATDNQKALVAGLSEAMRAWQQASADALGHANTALPPTDAWNELLKPFGLVTPAQPAAKPASRGGK